MMVVPSAQAENEILLELEEPLHGDDIDALAYCKPTTASLLDRSDSLLVLLNSHRQADLSRYEEELQLASHTKSRGIRRFDWSRESS